MTYTPICATSNKIDPLTNLRQTYLGHYAFGIDSAIGSSFNFAPQLYLQINEALANNDVAKAKKLQKTVTELYAALFKHGTSKMKAEICGEILTSSLRSHVGCVGVICSFVASNNRHRMLKQNFHKK